MERGGFEPPKAYAGRFTVCSLWPLGYLSAHFSPRISFRRALAPPCSTSPGAGLNRRPRPYQGRALPTELPGRENVDRAPSRRVLALRSSAVQEVRLRRSSLRLRRSGARSTFSRASPAFRQRRHSRAGDGNRTRDVQLGRLMLYQLSYSRDRRRGPASSALSTGSRRPESNRRPADYKSAALPSELRRPAGSSPPANVVVCCSTPLRLRHPC